MKKIYLLLTLFSSVMFAQTSSSSSSLKVGDTRDINNTPSDYRAEVRAEFKIRSIVGVPGAGLYSGMFTFAPWEDYSGNKNHQLNFNDGGVFYRSGSHESTWGNWKQLIMASENGNVALLGKLEAKEIKVTESPTADFVFEEDYNLPSLQEVEKHIKEKKHLPAIPSAKEMEKEGVNVGEFQIQLLQKIEELTLYIIELNKEINQLKNK